MIQDTPETKKMKSSKLMKYIIEEVHKQGVTGEEDTITVLTLKIMLRLVTNAKPTSSNILVSDTTGGGKDWVTKNICEVLLKEDITYFHRTALSYKTLNYWQPKNSSGKYTTWDGKVLYLEDPDEELIQCQAFKTMTSGENKITVLKDQKILDRKIEGKPVVIVTSMKTSIDDEGQRRWDAIRIDASQEVTEKVIFNAFTEATGKTNQANTDEKFRLLIQELQAYKVVIPFAEEIFKYYKNRNLIQRTQVHKLIDYIKASTVLHQYDRHVDNDGNLIAKKADYELARFAYLHLKNEEGNALNKKEEIVLDYLRDKGEPIKLVQIITELDDISKDWIYRHKDQMVSKGLISTITKFDAGSNKEVEHLKVNGGKKKVKNDLPSGKQIFGISDYLSSGQFYKEIDFTRQANNLKPLFKELYGGK